MIACCTSTWAKAPLAQLAERLPSKQKVSSSILLVGTDSFLPLGAAHGPAGGGAQRVAIRFIGARTSTA